MVTQNRRLKKKTDPPLNTEMQKHDDPGGVIYLWLTVEDIHPQTFIRFTEDLREKWKKTTKFQDSQPQDMLLLTTQFLDCSLVKKGTKFLRSAEPLQMGPNSSSMRILDADKSGTSRDRFPEIYSDL